MAAKYVYQSKPTLITIAQNLVLGMQASNPIFQYVFPITNRNSLRLRWRVKDNYSGLMKLRGAEGPPTRVNEVDENIYEAAAGVFGEFSTIGETRLMELGAGPGMRDDFDFNVSVEQDVAEKQAFLMLREKNRIRQMAWTLGRLGTLSIPLPGGGIGYRESVTVPSWTTPLPWTNPATSFPLRDLRYLQEAYGRGTSNQFGSGAVAIGNSKTLNLLYNNTNDDDWGGQKGPNGASMNTPGDYERIRIGQNIPQLITWDEGYLDDSNTFQLDVPDNELLIVANRPDGEKPGEFQMTYNAVSKKPGGYSFVDDRANPGPRQEVPPRLDVHAGFNGGLAPMRMGQVLRLIVGS